MGCNIQKGRTKSTKSLYIFGPDDVWSKHCGEINRRHLVDVLIASSVVKQVQQQFQQAAVGWWEQHEKQLKCLDLAFLVRHIRLIPLIIKESELWKWQMREKAKVSLLFPCLDLKLP